MRARTAGPWKIKDWCGDEWDGTEQPSVIEGNLTKEPDGTWYGEWVCKFEQMIPECEERQRGNSYLIAAAPDLLEACKLTEKFISAFASTLAKTTAFSESAYTLRQLRTAIAKAEGTT